MRLSGALHLTDWAFDETGTVNPLICSLSAVKRATLLINYYAYEYISIQQITDDLASSRLEGAMADIWAVVAHEGKISTRDICRRFNRKIEGEKMNAALAIRLINAIAEAGYGRIEGKILLFQEPKELAVNFNTSGETYADSLYDAMDKDLRDLSCNNVTPSHIDHYQEKTDANDVFFDAPGDPIIPRADSDSSDGDDSGGDNGSHPSGGLGKPVNPLPQGGNIAQMAITQVKEEVTSDRVAIPPSRIAKEGFKDAQGNQLEIGDTVKVCSDRWEGEGFHAGESGVIVALVNADEKGYSELNLGRGYIDFGKNRAITILSWQEIELVKKADSVSDF